MKHTKFVWTNKCEESFQRIKNILTITSMLKIADPFWEFVVCTNSCKEEVIGVFI